MHPFSSSINCTILYAKNTHTLKVYISLNRSESYSGFYSVHFIQSLGARIFASFYNMCYNCMILLIVFIFFIIYSSTWKRGRFCTYLMVYGILLTLFRSIKSNQCYTIEMLKSMNIIIRKKKTLQMSKEGSVCIESANSILSILGVSVCVCKMK